VYTMYMNKKGFTLMELLVVVAIIGILATITIVFFSDIRDTAQDTRGIRVAQNIVLAFNNEQDNSNIFPAYDDLSSIDTVKAAAAPGINIASRTTPGPSFCVSYRLLAPENNRELYKATQEGSDLVPLSEGEC